MTHRVSSARGPAPPPACAFQLPSFSKVRWKPLITALPSWLNSRGGRTNQRVSTCNMAAAATAILPMEPQPISIRRQWFEGWFFRLVDHSSSSNVAVIFGSLRRPDKEPPSDGPFHEHLLVLAYTERGVQRMSSVLLESGAVQLRGRETADASSSLGAHALWWSNQHGGMRIDGDTATLDLTMPGRLRLVANVSAPRVVWDPHEPDRAGPEGWLRRTSLYLPCHYFVHSFGSPTRYVLNHPHGAHGALRDRSGEATAHIERNYGDSFPSGWVWAQAAAPAGSAYLVLTGGRFVIGPVTTNTYVIALRTPAFQWDFRTTDLDRVAEARRPCDGVLRLNATSRNGRRRLELVLRAPPNSFGERIMVPTAADGFSDNPGCRESHVATADLVAWDAAAGQALLRKRVGLAVLEFGGTFQCDPHLAPRRT